MTAIRKHLPDFLAIIGLLIVAVAVSSVILGKQRLSLPGWVPVIGKNWYYLNAEMTTTPRPSRRQSGNDPHALAMTASRAAVLTRRDSMSDTPLNTLPRFGTSAGAQQRELNAIERTRNGAAIAPPMIVMKTVTRLRFSTIARAARVVLLVAVVAALAALIADRLPRQEKASPTGSEHSAPAEEHSHYNFPTYA